MQPSLKSIRKNMTTEGRAGFSGPCILGTLRKTAFRDQWTFTLKKETERDLPSPQLRGTRTKYIRTALFCVHYAAGSGNFLPMMRDNLSVPFSVVDQVLDP